MPTKTKTLEQKLTCLSLAQKRAFLSGAYEWAMANALKDSAFKDERALRFQVWYCDHYDGPPARKVKYSYLTAWRRYSERLNARIGIHAPAA